MRRIRKKRELSLDIAPVNLIDLLLVMLIFFVTTTTFLQLKMIDLELPTSKNDNTTYLKDHTHIVNINAKGEYFLDKKMFKKLALTLELTKIKDADKKAIFQIGADATSKHQFFIDLLMVFKELNIENISIITKDN